MRKALLALALIVIGCGGGQKTETAPVSRLPPAEPEPASDDSGILPPERYEEISQHFRQKRPVVARCYGNALTSKEIDAKASGAVTIALSITPEGAPKNVHVTQTTLKSKVVEDCVVETVKSWQLPAPGGATEFSFTYEFAPE